MNFPPLVMLLLSGFGISFLVMDVARMFARERWPQSASTAAGNFTAFSVFLALFAGPALLFAALWRMTTGGRAHAADLLVGSIVACGWACCYGLVVSRCVALLAANGA